MRSGLASESARNFLEWDFTTLGVGFRYHSTDGIRIDVVPVHRSVFKQHQRRRYRAFGVGIATFRYLPLDDPRDLILESDRDCHASASAPYGSAIVLSPHEYRSVRIEILLRR
jgi:hypothetical protein